MKINLKKYIAWILLIALAFFVRFYQVTESPPAPYWEEVALGYDAYSISETGKDHHGTPFPLVAFESFGDWKPSGYFYALVPFIKIFGLNVLAVRLPSILAGVMIVIGIGVLAKLIGLELKLSKEKVKWLSFFSIIVAAFSPWLIQFSRGGWEVNLATALILWGAIFGLKSLRENRKNKFTLLSWSALLLILSMYTYHSARVLAPILGIFFGLSFFKKNLFKNKSGSKYLIPILIVLISALPFLKTWDSPQLGQRIAETSIFSDLSIIEQSNDLKEQFNNVWWSKLIYHRYLLFSKKIVQQFLTHFSLDFLFISGDVNPRHGSQYFGLFYPFEIIFMAWGFIKLFSKKYQRATKLILLWIVFGVLPAALTKTVPHALRILPIAPILILMVGLGLTELRSYFNKIFKKFSPATLLILVAYFLSIYALMNHLTSVYPKRHGESWMVGYEEKIMVLEKEVQENPEQTIEFSRSMGRPAMYYWFYTKTDPREVQALNDVVNKDQGEFLEFKNIRFVD